MRYPQRSTRSTIGLLVSVTLITTFGVAMRTFGDMVEAAAGNDPVYYAGIETMLTTVTAVFSVLIGFSAVIAGVGLVNSLSLGVLQRTRELGLLRALGFSARAAAAHDPGRERPAGAHRRRARSACSARSTAGPAPTRWSARRAGCPASWFVGLPWPLLAVVVAGGVLLTVVASVAPARRATRVAPVEALGVE